MFDELIKLLKAYGSGKHTDSFKSCALSLLHFVGYRCGRYAELLPRITALDKTRAFKSGAPYLLAHLHQTGQPLREDFALALATKETSCRKSTPTIRVNRELTALFQHRFIQSRPEGIRLFAAKESFHVKYHPASTSLALRDPDRLVERLPLMIGLFGEPGQLSTLWNRCVADLSNYSRAISKPLATTQLRINACRALPAEIRLPATNPVFERFTQLLGRAQAFDGYRIVKVGVLAQLMGFDSYENLTAARARSLSAAIQELGWRIAPDPTICGGLPPWKSWEQELALFQPLALEPSPQLPLLSGILYLTAIVCGRASGKSNWKSFAGRSRHKIAQADWSYLHGAALVLRRNPGIALSSLGAIAKAIAPTWRESVFVALSEVAGSSGDISVEQVRRLLRIGRAFEIDALQVRAIVEKSLGHGEAIVLRENSSAGERIPLRTEPFALDITRIEALSIETREVAALLSEIMTDDPGEAEKLEEPASPQGPDWLTQLESRFHAPLLPSSPGARFPEKTLP